MSCLRPEAATRGFAKFTGKHLRQSLFLNKVAGLGPATLLKRLWRSCFLVDFAKFLRTPFLQNTSGRLFLKDAFLNFEFGVGFSLRLPKGSTFGIIRIFFSIRNSSLKRILRILEKFCQCQKEWVVNST